MMTEERERLKNQIIKLVEEKGYPGELGALAADSLGSEKAMTRMIGWLSHSESRSAEDIVDEMLAICEDRDNWRKKKEAEFYQQKYNQYLWDMKK